MTQHQKNDAKKKVDDTLQVWKEHDYTYEKYDNRFSFFYKQVNSQIGVLIAYANASNSRGDVNRHYDLHCFDLFIYKSTKKEDAIALFFKTPDTALSFWIPCINPYNTKHVEVIQTLDNEKETDFEILDLKYKQLINS